MKDDENRMSFINNIKIRDGKAYTIHSALSSKIEKLGGAECLNGFRSYGEKLKFNGWA